jgi:putative transposase
MIRGVPYHRHRRNLPHEFPDRTPIFFTWGLYGSLPEIKSLAKLDQNESKGAKSRRIDRLLDRAARGPRWLQNPGVAAMVSEEITVGASKFHRYELLEYVVMPNHVHLLIFPHTDPSISMALLKGVTARRANRILHREGLPFWQLESFDHWCRSSVEVLKIRGYITENPVKAGLVQRAQDWPWSSVHRRLERKQAKLVQRVVGREL